MRGHCHIVIVVVLALAACGNAFADLIVHVGVSGTGPYTYEYALDNTGGAYDIWGFMLEAVTDWLPGPPPPDGWGLDQIVDPDTGAPAFLWTDTDPAYDLISGTDPGVVHTGSFFITSGWDLSPGYVSGKVYDYSIDGYRIFQLDGPGPPPVPPYIPPPGTDPGPSPEFPTLPTPEPGAWLLLASSALGLLARRRRQTA